MSVFINAQKPPSYYNKTYGDSIRGNYSTQIIRCDNYYYVASSNWVYQTPAQFDIYKFDTLLNLIQQKNVAINNKDLYFNSPKGLAYNKTDSSFFVTGFINEDFYSTGQPKFHGMLWKLNKKLDTLWHKSYINTNDSSIIFTGNIIQNNYILLYGQSKEFDINGDAFTVKVDFNGNELWRRTYQIPNIFGGFSKLIKTKQKNYLGIENLLDHPAWGYSNIKITSYDTLFNVIWSQIYNTPYADLLGDLIELSDSNYAFTQGYCDSQSNPPIGSLYTRPCITKINRSNGGIIWQKKYAKVKFESQLFKIYESASKKLYALGNTVTAYSVQPSGTYISNMLVTNQNGDSLNYQEIFADSISQNNYLFDLAPTYHGFNCIGRAGLAVYTGTTVTGWEYQNWLVKADTNGCFNQTCTDAITGVIEQTDKSVEELKIYPNPASTIVNMQLPISIGIYDTSFECIIFDSNGKQLFKQPIKQKHFMLDVTKYSPGLYFVVVTYNSIVRFKQKLIIN